MRPVCEQRNSDEVKQQRMEYVEWIMAIDKYEVNNHFIYINESGFQIIMFKRRGYAPHGVTSNIKVALKSVEQLAVKVWFIWRPLHLLIVEITLTPTNTWSFQEL